MTIPTTTLLLAALLACAAPAAAGTFTPKSYVKAALEASPAMRKAEQAFRQAESGYKSALLDAALPSFSLNLGETFYDQSDPRLRLERADVTSSLSAAWNLYDSAGSPLNKVRTARLNYESAKLAFLEAKQAEAVKALNRFYALYSSQRRIGTAKMNLASRERQYKDTNEQYQSGTRSRMQVTQSEGDKLQSELSLAQAESAEAKARMAFNELVNAEPEEEQLTEVSTQTASVALPLPKSDAAKALQNNFGLRQQRLALERTRITNRNSVLANYPRLRVDAGWRKSGLGLIGEPAGPQAGNPSYSLGASLNFPFGFFGLQNYLDIGAAGAALRSAELDLESSERALKTSVLSAQKDIELQVKSRQLLEFQVKAQKDTTENLMSEYSLGGADSLQLDSAQTKLLDASNAQIAAVNDFDLALANYRVLLGERVWE
ncbi:MAG: hypothetical protein A2X32_03235 [Elusimicrobia bacterium GWC2_64_44]|nr:MAG: hypothetical protein A2X32_03235 [Elusimicrobia bacterium GWC2_64_44]